jgi:TPP-dependent pyruvate/acetoin dehydrogenase alpha subunit
MPTTTAHTEKPSAALTRQQLLEMYYFVRLTRDLEERLTILFRQSKVVGGLYRSLGQEGESVAAAYALELTDAILPLIRNMGALVTMGVRPKEIFLQYMAKADSNSRGRDLNIHVVHFPSWLRAERGGGPSGDGGAAPEVGPEPVVVGPISMLGDSIPVAAGIAMGARMRGKNLVAMAWIGDGATSTGAFHEGLNFAAVQKAPLVVVAEDNKYAYSTPVSKQMAIARIDERAAAYGIPHEMVDGNDMLAVGGRRGAAGDRHHADAGARAARRHALRPEGPAGGVGEEGPDRALQAPPPRRRGRQREGARRDRRDDEALCRGGGRPGRGVAHAGPGNRDARRVRGRRLRRPAPGAGEVPLRVVSAAPRAEAPAHPIWLS